jgi:DNA-binding response OmpR family regulator
MSRILIVDDVEAAEDLAMVLAAVGHETEMAFDGWQAIEAFKDFDPDVVFFDLEMGFFDGFDAARAIRGEINGQHPFLVAVSAIRGAEIEVATRAAGFDLYMKKPFDPHSIIAIATDRAQRRPLR